MTAISWTEPASADFLGIVEWIEERNPTAAIRVGRRILDAAELLADHPSLGKPGRSPDTRELAHIYHKTIIFSNEYSYPIDIAHLSP